MFCIYFVMIKKFILTFRWVGVLYLFCNDLEIHSYHGEDGYFVSLL